MTTQEVETFIEAFQTLVMASVNSQGEPHASTAPFVREGGRFYILISTIAQHGRNLLASTQTSLLLAEDEKECIQPFARKRITLETEVSEIDRETEQFQRVIEYFSKRFDPDLVKSLAQMGDFHLFELKVLSGSAVMGFGKAYRLDQNLEIMAQITGQHQKGSR